MVTVVSPVSAADPCTLPEVPGFTTEIYAAIPVKLEQLSFDPSGVAYVGQDDLGKIFRIGVGGSPIEEYGTTPLPDPDAVLVDADGTISGVPGAVLVGGNHTWPTHGYLSAILPNQSVVPIFGPTTAFANPAAAMLFDRKGRLTFTDANTGRVYRTPDGSTLPAIVGSITEAYHGILVDAQHRIYTRTNDGRIQLHDEHGSPIDIAYISGIGAHGFGHLGMAFGPGGIWGTDLYIVDSLTEELVRYDADRVRTVVGTCFQDADAPHIRFGPHDGALYVNLRRAAVPKIVRIGPAAVGLDLDPNTINLRVGADNLTGYIAPDMYLDAWDIDVSTVRMTQIAIAGEVLVVDVPAEAFPVHHDDFDGDGVTDLMVKFSRAPVISALDGRTGQATFTVLGETFAGLHFSGEDTRRIIDRGKP